MSFSRNTRAYLDLPYNPELKNKARELRKAGNLSEVLLWQQLKKKQLLGLDFDRQKIIGNYIVDFYNANCHVVIEIDGESHLNKYEYDKKRENYLTALDLKVIHFDDLDVKQNLQGVMDYLEKELSMQLKSQLKKEQFPSFGGVAAGRGGLNVDVGENDFVSAKVFKPPHASRTPPEEGNLTESFCDSEFGLPRQTASVTPPKEGN